MAKRPFTDYPDKSREAFEVPAAPLPQAIPTPSLDDHLGPEPQPRPPEAQHLHGIFRYMGDYSGIDFYGIWFERKEWVEIYDPHIAKKARGNIDFETQGKTQENENKSMRRAQAINDRDAYTQAQEARLKRAAKNADKVLGND